MPKLTIIKGPEKGRVLHISSKETEPMIIGRKGVMFSINDPLASRKHAQFIHKDGKWYVRDLKSSNGTFLNGDKLAKPKRLNNGDIIQIGTSKVLVGKPKKSASAEKGGQPDEAVEAASAQAETTEEPQTETAEQETEEKQDTKPPKPKKQITLDDEPLKNGDPLDASSLLLDILDDDEETEEDIEIPDYMPDYDPLDPKTHRSNRNGDENEDDSTIVVPGDMLARIAEEIGDIDEGDDDDKTIDADAPPEDKPKKKKRK